MKKVILILSILFTNLTMSQVKFEANVSKETLGINENLRVDFKMNKDGDNFTPPNFSGFDKFFKLFLSIKRSIFFSILSDNFIPSGPNNFNPLS